MIELMPSTNSTPTLCESWYAKASLLGTPGWAQHAPSPYIKTMIPIHAYTVYRDTMA